MLKLLFINWLMIILLMTIVWVIYLCIKNTGIIDVFWPITILLSGFHYLSHFHLNASSSVIALLLFIWAFRLSGYLFFTRIIPQIIEKRYIDISDTWKTSKNLGFFMHFQFQGILGMIIAMPFLFVAQNFSLSLFIAIIVVLFGIIFESISDLQLQQFRKNYPGKVCDAGLWNYSRHPNYFFEWLIWMGFSLAGLNFNFGWLSFISPLFLLFLMLKITGPITERASIKSRGEAYLSYQKKTSMFFPMPHKNI